MSPAGPLWTGLSWATLRYCGLEYGESCELWTAVTSDLPWTPLLRLPLNSGVENRPLSQLCCKCANTCCYERGHLCNPRGLRGAFTASICIYIPQYIYLNIYIYTSIYLWIEVYFAKWHFVTHCSSCYILPPGPCSKTLIFLSDETNLHYIMGREQWTNGQHMERFGMNNPHH